MDDSLDDLMMDESRGCEVVDSVRELARFGDMVRHGGVRIRDYVVREEHFRDYQHFLQTN